MSIESQPDPFTPFRFLRASHRTIPEQAFGLAIFFLLSVGLGFVTHFAVPYSICLALSMWTLWRRYSLRILKLELSLFLAQFFFQTIWSLSFYTFREGLLSLAAILLLWCTTLVATFLYWRKERLSGGILIPVLVWGFYLVGLNYMLSMRF